MIRINAIRNSSAAKNYFRSPDYYVDGQVLTAFWHGKGAELLGLSGEVQWDDFARLCDNERPDGSQLTAKTIENRRVGYDWTFSVPKSASVMYALGGDERIAGAFRNSVAATMAEIERQMKTRVRKQGADHDRNTGNLIWCDFLHQTSRPIDGYPDPQLHIHAVAFNATYDREEGQWKAGQFGDLKKDGAYYQAVFRSRLATELQNLGYELKVSKGDFEIVGVSDRVKKEFSRRTGLIEKLADQLGVTRPETKAKLGATSREAKKEGQSWESLLRHWVSRVSDQELAAIRGTVADMPMVFEERNASAVDFALAHLTERRSVVDQRQVMTEALKFGLGYVTPEGIAKELARPGIIRRPKEGRVDITTQGVLSEEKKLVAWAKEGRGRCKPLRKSSAAPLARQDGANHATPAGLGQVAESPVATNAVVESKPGLGFTQTLSPSQQAAFDHILTSPDRLMVVRGIAGAGKSTMLQAVMPQLRCPWVVLAPSVTASRGELRDAGFEGAETLAKFLGSKEMQAGVKNGLVVLDEAGMAGIKDVVRLVQLADSQHARVLLLGDRKQHRSVTRGDVLGLLEEKAGVPIVEVGEIKRQAGAYKQAVEALAEGKVLAGFDQLQGLGWVVDSRTPMTKSHNGADSQDESTSCRLVDDYLSTLKEGKTALVISPTHAAGDTLTEQIRDRLMLEGKLGEEREFTKLVPLHYTEAQLKEARTNPEEGVVLQRFGAYKPETIHIAKGDLLRATSGIKDIAGHRIDNGSMLTVVGFDKGIQVRTGSDAIRTLDPGVGHLTHGYVTTSHASQGRTVDRVMIDMTAANFPAVGAEQFYVSVSRGRQQATIYTDSVDQLRHAIQKHDHRPFALDLVERPKKKVRRNHKKYLSWMRNALIVARDAIRGHQPEVSREREGSFSRG